MNTSRKYIMKLFGRNTWISSISDKISLGRRYAVIAIIVNLLLVSQVMTARQSKAEIVSVVDWLLEQYGIWNWEYPFEMDELVDFWTNKMPQISDVVSSAEDVKSIEKTLLFLKKHPRKYTYTGVNWAPVFIIDRNNYTWSDRHVNPTEFTTHPERRFGYFYETRSVAMDSVGRVFVDASQQLSLLRKRMGSDISACYDESSQLEYVAVEYDCAQDVLFKVFTWEQAPFKEEALAIISRHIAEYRTRFPNVRILRFCLLIPIQCITEPWYYE